MKIRLPQSFHPMLLGAALTVTAAISPASASLLINGGFENSGTGTWETSPIGNNGYPSGHFTSQYRAHPGYIGDEGSYSIETRGSTAHGGFRNITPYEGNYMMVINGANDANTIVWQSEAITIAANTDYTFSGFVTNLNNDTGWSEWKSTQAKLGFEVYLNGSWQHLGSIIDLTLPEVNPNLWHELSVTFNSASNTSIMLRLTNLQTAASGNDFALDGLDFSVADPIPEPSTFALLGLAGAAALIYRRKR